jgi:hypothetical protein
MGLPWKLQKQSAGLLQTPATAGNNRRGSNGLNAKIEKSFIETFLFLLSMIFYLSHSLEEEHRTRS